MIKGRNGGQNPVITWEDLCSHREALEERVATLLCDAK